MFAFIKGKLVQANPLYVVVEANGVGYKISIGASTFAKIPMIESDILLYTSFVVREFSQALYGFISDQDRELFESLMNVSGIGPKSALSLIGHMDTYDLCQAISQQNIQQICKVPGIGKKTAERLVIEMRDKLPQFISVSEKDRKHYLPTDPKMQIVSDAMSALINLGYNQMTAEKAIKKTLKDIPEGSDLPALITGALKNI